MATFNLVKSTIFVTAPTSWTDAQSEAALEEIQEFLEKLEGALRSGIEEINSDLEAHIE